MKATVGHFSSVVGLSIHIADPASGRFLGQLGMIGFGLDKGPLQSAAQKIADAINAAPAGSSPVAEQIARQVVDGVCNDRGWSYRAKLLAAITLAVRIEAARGDALAVELAAAKRRADEATGFLEAAEARASDAEERAEAAEARAEAAEAKVLKPASLLRTADEALPPGCHCRPGCCVAPRPEWCRDAGKRNAKAGPVEIDTTELEAVLARLEAAEPPQGWPAVCEMATADLHAEIDRRMQRVRGARRTLHLDPKQSERIEALAAEVRRRLPPEVKP